LLLRFRVRNHASLRDEQTLSLVVPGLKSAIPRSGSWTDHLCKVAGIYGANASGKSNVLRALRFISQAVLQSATSWRKYKAFPHTTFALDSKHHDLPSLYEIDLLFEGVRYTYGFESGYSGVSSEWLYSYQKSRPRTLFERTGDGIVFGRTLPGENQRIARLLKPNVLYLSLAYELGHPLLEKVATAITDGIMYADYGEPDLTARLHWIWDPLKADAELLRKTAALLRLADLGVSGVELTEREINDDLRVELERIYGSSSSSEDESDKGASAQIAIDNFRKRIRLGHTGSDNSIVHLNLESESDGTIAWLSLVVPALYSMQHGRTLVIDEIDASLHPRMTAMIIRLFKDEELNKGGGQLIFSSHDSSLLGPLAGDRLEPYEVWFTEKSSDGSSSLYSLDEFTVRKQDNIERKYLQGRYGAVPMIGIEEIRHALIGEH